MPGKPRKTSGVLRGVEAILSISVLHLIILIISVGYAASQIGLAWSMGIGGMWLLGAAYGKASIRHKLRSTIIPEDLVSVRSTMSREDRIYFGNKVHSFMVEDLHQTEGERRKVEKEPKKQKTPNERQKSKTGQGKKRQGEKSFRSLEKDKEGVNSLLDSEGVDFNLGDIQSMFGRSGNGKNGSGENTNGERETSEGEGEETLDEIKETDEETEEIEKKNESEN